MINSPPECRFHQASTCACFHCYLYYLEHPWHTEGTQEVLLNECINMETLVKENEQTMEKQLKDMGTPDRVLFV